MIDSVGGIPCNVGVDVSKSDFPGVAETSQIVGGRNTLAAGANDQIGKSHGVLFSLNTDRYYARGLMRSDSRHKRPGQVIDRCC